MTLVIAPMDSKTSLEKVQKPIKYIFVFIFLLLRLTNNPTKHTPSLDEVSNDDLSWTPNMLTGQESGLLFRLSSRNDYCQTITWANTFLSEECKPTQIKRFLALRFDWIMSWKAAASGVLHQKWRFRVSWAKGPDVWWITELARLKSLQSVR